MKRFTPHLIGLSIAAFVLLGVMAYDRPSCQHIYVAVEQKEVKVKYPNAQEIAIYRTPPTGKHEEGQLVCVKCFHLTKQIVDYGNPVRLPE